MTDKKEELLARMIDVCEASKHHVPIESAVQQHLDIIDHNSTLHLNPYFPPNKVKRLAKQVAQCLSMPFYRKQVAYNLAVRDVLKQLVYAVTELQQEVHVLHDRLEQAETDSSPSP